MEFDKDRLGALIVAIAFHMVIVLILFFIFMTSSIECCDTSFALWIDWRFASQLLMRVNAMASWVFCKTVSFICLLLLYNPSITRLVGRGGSVGIATGYGLDRPGIGSRWGARFSAPFQTGPGAHPASCTMGTWSFPGVKCGQGVTLTPHSLLSAVVKKE